MHKRYHPDSFHLQWHITEKCNLRCKHCYFDERLLEQELSFSELLNILEDFLSFIKKLDLPKSEVKISITGGEPLIRKDFIPFIQKLFQYKRLTKIGLLTNGILLNKDSLKKIKELDYIQFSLEGMKKNNDEVRGFGTFNKVIEEAYLAIKAKLRVGLSITVTKKNIEDIPEIINLAVKIGINVVALRRFVPIGRGEEFKKWMLSPKEAKKFYLYTAKEKDKLNFKNSKTKIILGCEDGILSQEGYAVNGCSAGFSSLTILPNGDVYPCRRLPVYVGNLKKNSIEEIFYGSEKLREMRNLNNIDKICKNCPYFNKCKGGAKCVSYGYYGAEFKNSYFLPDPQCWRLFNND